MDIPAILDHLGYADQDWGNLATADTYEAFVTGWRGTVPPPAKAEMQSAWATIQSERAAETQHRATAQQRRDRIRSDIGDRSEQIDLALAAGLGALLRGEPISSIPARYRRVLQRLETIALDQSLWPGDEDQKPTVAPEGPLP